MVKIHEGPVYLEPIEHVYIHRETGERFTSVTKVISSIEEEFESENIALAISRQSNNQKKDDYIGMTKDQILEYWQQLNDDANVYGTRVHELVEAYLFAGKYPIAKDDFEWDVINAYDELGVDEGKCVYPERIMYSPEYKLAGTADLCIDIDDDWFDIGDWKTNKAFNFFSPYGKTLLKPFDHLQDCQYSVYSLQLSTYALMYEMETGKKCRQIWIGFWDKITRKFSRIPVIYLKNEAKKLLEFHKYSNFYM